MNEIYSHKILISLTSVIIATSVILLKPSYFQTTVTIEIKKVSSLNNLKQKKNIFTNHEIKDLFLTSPTLNYLNTNKQLPFSSSLSITKNKLFFVIDGSDKTMNSIFFEKSLSKLRSFFSLKYKDSIENFQTIREDLVLNLKDLERVKNKLLQREGLSTSEKVKLTDASIKISNEIWSTKTQLRSLSDSLRDRQEKGFKVLKINHIGKSKWFFRSLLLFIAISSIGPLLSLTWATKTKGEI